MLEDAHLISSVAYGVDLHGDGAYFALVDAASKDYLFFVIRREATSAIVVNDWIGGQWGQEVFLGMPPAGTADRGYFEFKFNGTFLEVWNPTISIEFPRFDQRRAESGRFIRLQNASVTDSGLKLRTGSLDVAMARIESHLLHRRIDALEAGLMDPATVATAASR